MPAPFAASPTHRGPVGFPTQRLSCSHSQPPPFHLEKWSQAPSTQLCEHSNPPDPHAVPVAPRPDTHIPLLQHPPLHFAETPSHEVEHMCDAWLQASPIGHSALVAQPQIPAKQLWPVHALPHAPQFFGSLCVLEHELVPAQYTRVGDAHWQFAPKQICAEGHLAPHAPQLLALLVRSTHDVPQSVGVLPIQPVTHV